MLVLVVAALMIACQRSSITSCDNEHDVSGAWTLSLVASNADAGVTHTIDNPITIEAQLEQAGATDFLGIGHFVYGTLTSPDPGAFGALSIPRLTMNDGSKSGAILGCMLRINVPIAMPVSDDNVDQGALRIALAGQVDAPGHLVGLPGSRLVRTDDRVGTTRDFAWSGHR